MTLMPLQVRLYFSYGGDWDEKTTAPDGGPGRQEREKCERLGTHLYERGVAESCEMNHFCIHGFVTRCFYI